MVWASFCKSCGNNSGSKPTWLDAYYKTDRVGGGSWVLLLSASYFSTSGTPVWWNRKLWCKQIRKRDIWDSVIEGLKKKCFQINLVCLGNYLSWRWWLYMFQWHRDLDLCDVGQKICWTLVRRGTCCVGSSGRHILRQHMIGRVPLTSNF